MLLETAPCSPVPGRTVHGRYAFTLRLDDATFSQAMHQRCLGGALLLPLHANHSVDFTVTPWLNNLSCALQDAVVIGARLDFDSCGDSCRLAFYGRLLEQLGPGGPQELQRLHVYKVKTLRKCCFLACMHKSCQPELGQ